MRRACAFARVRASGEYDAARQILLDNKVHAGQAGYDVVAPLRLAGSDRFVLVDRGWIAQGASRAQLPVVPPPEGRVTVIGRANLPPRRYLELSREPRHRSGLAEPRYRPHRRCDRARAAADHHRADPAGRAGR